MAMIEAVRLLKPRLWARVAIPSTSVTWNIISSSVAACQIVSPVA